MTVGERIKKIRSDLNMTQSVFSNKLGIGQSTLAMMEVSKRPISDRHVKTICALFHVSDVWLKTGEGDMYVPDSSADIFDSMRDELKLSVVEEKILRKYFELGMESRQAVADFIIGIGTELQPPAADPIQQEVDAYKKELLARQEAASASDTGEESTKNRA
jgi:transcriptional regulator with XRE-family HTH domain